MSEEKNYNVLPCSLIKDTSEHTIDFHNECKFCQKKLEKDSYFKFNQITDKGKIVLCLCPDCADELL